jgi:outer membrane cobalamin receptor
MGLACTALLLVGTPVTAQTDSDFSVTVTERSELVEQVGTTRRIGRDEIQARNARTLDEALQLVPGLYIRTGGDGTPRIDVRGFRSRHVLLLINGVQVNSTSDGQFDPARISTDSIREIKVSYGSSSILYGDNALAGVIEITTIDSQSDASVEVSAGTPDQERLGGRVARTIGRWSLTGSASGYDTDGYRLPGSFTATPQEDGGRRQNSDRRRGDLRGAVGYRLSPAASLSTEWAVGTGRYGVPGSVIANSADIFAQTPRFDRVTDYRASTGQVSLTISPSRRFNLRAWGYRNAQREDSARYDDATYSSMDDPLVAGTFRTRERTTVTGSSALGRLDLSSFGSLRLAVNQRRESFTSNGIIRDVTIAGSSGGGGGGGGGRGGGAGSSTPTTFGVRSFATGEHVDVY